MWPLFCFYSLPAGNPYGLGPTKSEQVVAKLVLEWLYFHTMLSVFSFNII